MPDRRSKASSSSSQRFDDQIKYINQRLDDQDRSIDQRFDDQIKYINQRFDAEDQRLDDQDKYINQRFDAVNHGASSSKTNASRTSVKMSLNSADSSTAVTRNETRIDALTEQLQTVDAPSP